MTDSPDAAEIAAMQPAMCARWIRSHRADPEVVPLADRHYNRQKIGSPQFAPPGRCLVLKTAARDAFWITSWPFAQYVRHAWPGAWVCSAFRNESAHAASELIREAVAATLAEYGPAPEIGMITFVDTRKVRRTRKPGYTFARAGFRHCGWTKGGLYAMQHRRARLRLKAREIVAAHERGETVDPHSLEWAQFVDRHNRPAAGWLGDPEKTE